MNKKPLLTLSPDEQSILDEAGNVAFVAKKHDDGGVYYEPAGNDLTDGKKRWCIGWDTQEVCIKWGVEDGQRVCVSVTQKRFCIEYAEEP